MYEWNKLVLFSFFVHCLLLVTCLAHCQQVLSWACHQYLTLNKIKSQKCFALI